MTAKKDKSALNVSKGVSQPSDINPEAVSKVRSARKDTIDTGQSFDGIRKGNTKWLSQGITLVESAHPEHQKYASQIVELCLPYDGNSFRIGITGVPGAGKSTFISSFGKYLLEQKHKIAVLTIDPSSERSGGSILGDKTRMEELSGHANVFIRPSPSGGTLGGVARKTREAITLCEAAGYDIIIVETVGVGQSETTVHSLVDFFLLLMVPGTGDELQGLKRGIMEMADSIVINKADGNTLGLAEKARAEFLHALHLFPMPSSDWNPRVELVSSLEGKGIPETWDMISEYRAYTTKNGYFQKRRREQNAYWMNKTLNEGLQNRFFNDEKVKDKIKELQSLIETGKFNSFSAAKALLDTFLPDNTEHPDSVNNP